MQAYKFAEVYPGSAMITILVLPRAAADRPGGGITVEVRAESPFVQNHYAVTAAGGLVAAVAAARDRLARHSSIPKYPGAQYLREYIKSFFLRASECRCRGG
jgi:hypothetical protein